MKSVVTEMRELIFGMKTVTIEKTEMISGMKSETAGTKENNVGFLCIFRMILS